MIKFLLIAFRQRKLFVDDSVVDLILKTIKMKSIVLLSLCTSLLALAISVKSSEANFQVDVDRKESSFDFSSSASQISKQACTPSVYLQSVHSPYQVFFRSYQTLASIKDTFLN